jgi:hypothetical protein
VLGKHQHAVEETANASDFSHAADEALGHVEWDQAVHLAAEADYLFHQARTDERISTCRLQEYSFDLWGETPVHQGHLELIFVVGDGADATQDGRGPALASEIDHQPFEGGDGDIAQLTSRFLEHLDPLVDSEERVFDRVIEDSDGKMLEELGSASDQIQMSVGRRIKGPWIDGSDASAHLISSLESPAGPRQGRRLERQGPVELQQPWSRRRCLAFAGPERRAWRRRRDGP